MNINNYQFIIVFFIALILSIIFTNIIRYVAKKYKILDIPKGNRKIHRKPIPLLGGLAIFGGFTIAIIIYILWNNSYFDGYMMPKYIFGIILGGAVLMLGGILDDKYNLKPGKQIIWPILASVVIIATGIGIDFISNPLGETFNLNVINIKIFEIWGIPYFFTPIADIFTFLWLMGMIYTTKFLDGLDGLASGVTIIGSIILFFLSLMPEVMQPETAIICIILAGSTLGFLFYNFNPAKIFLGEGGSTILGFMLGTLSIISGGKIATAILIMGIPILDVVWVILRRIMYKKSPFKTADKKHLHFRLLHIGFSHKAAVIFLYAISAAFGLLALLTEGKYKLYTIITLIIFMIVLGTYLVLKEGKYIKRLDK